MRRAHAQILLANFLILQFLTLHSCIISPPDAFHRKIAGLLQAYQIIFISRIQLNFIFLFDGFDGRGAQHGRVNRQPILIFFAFLPIFLLSSVLNTISHRRQIPRISSGIYPLIILNMVRNSIISLHILFSPIPRSVPRHLRRLRLLNVGLALSRTQLQIYCIDR